MKCVSYTRTLPWKNHQSELTIAEQNQRIAAWMLWNWNIWKKKSWLQRFGGEQARKQSR